MFPGRNPRLEPNSLTKIAQWEVFVYGSIIIPAIPKAHRHSGRLFRSAATMRLIGTAHRQAISVNRSTSSFLLATPLKSLRSDTEWRWDRLLLSPFSATI